MVSSGEVQSDAKTIQSLGTKFTSQVDSLGSSWKGNSFTSLSTQSNDVLNSYINTVINQLNQLASACVSYNNYLEYERAYNTASDNYNIACRNKDARAQSKYSSEMNNYSDDMRRYKEEALSTLNAICGTKLEATSIPTKDYSSGKTISMGSISGSVQNAIDWALAIAADDSHGYSQQTRWGNPNYDCSSLVISAYDAAGFGVKDAGATYTGDMRSAFTSMGFEWIPGNPDVESLQPGDILLNEGEHTEMYIGDGMNVGAHGDSDGVNGDSNGGEISVSGYYSFPWNGVLRYTGETTNT